jgi:hypothetical protein
LGVSAGAAPVAGVALKTSAKARAETRASLVMETPEVTLIIGQ